jgi:O-methyltransferase
VKTILHSILFYQLHTVRRIRYFFIFLSLRHFTMIPRRLYIANLELCRHYKKIEGDVIECGTWRGGMISGIARMLGNDRTYHLFDSFEGLPKATELDGAFATSWQQEKTSSDYRDNLRANEKEAEQALIKSGVSTYVVHKGWFRDTLPFYKSDKGIAILRMDGDWYDSTMDCLKYLYPQVNVGGLIIIDDYFMWEGCSKAVHDFLSVQKSSSRFNFKKGILYLQKQ